MQQTTENVNNHRVCYLGFLILAKGLWNRCVNLKINSMRMNKFIEN